MEVSALSPPNTKNRHVIQNINDEQFKMKKNGDNNRLNGMLTLHDTAENVPGMLT